MNKETLFWSGHRLRQEDCGSGMMFNPGVQDGGTGFWRVNDGGIILEEVCRNDVHDVLV